MRGLLNSYFDLFVDKSGLTDEIAHCLSWGDICTIALGIIACLFGFWAYRTYFSALVLMGIVIVFCTLLSELPWGQVVAWMSVTGVVVAFLAYRWYHFGGFCICMLIGGCVGWLIYPSYVLAGLLGIAFGAAEWFFPVITIATATSLWGAWMLFDGFGVDAPMKTVGILLAMSIGIALQMFMNRKQKMFAKPIPQKLRYRLEKRRK
jgi:hypothetical protein